jgi:hypothetical protein
MSPTEFSNYIKQRQQLQQHNNHYHHQPNHHHQNIFGAIGSVSPARSISPNPMTNLSSAMTNDSSMHQNPFVFPSNGFNLNMYHSPRGMFDGNMTTNGGGTSGNYNHFNGGSSNDPLLFTPGKCSSFMDQQSNFCKIPSQQQQGSQSAMPTSPQASANLIANGNNGNGAIGSSSSAASNQQQQSENKLLEGINFYNNNANPSYQHHLLVAN